MASQGPYLATEGTNGVENGSTPWVNPENVVGQDFAVATTSGAADDFSVSLKATGHGFTIPAGATIDGIEVEHYALDGFVDTIRVGLLINYLPDVTFKTGSVNLGWGKLGSPTDTWGRTWTPSEINASGFGSGLRLSGSSLWDGEVDAERITVYYTAAENTQKAYPDVDLDAASWTATPLWQKVDETVASDADFITTTAS